MLTLSQTFPRGGGKSCQISFAPQPIKVEVASNRQKLDRFIRSSPLELDPIGRLQNASNTSTVSDWSNCLILQTISSFGVGVTDDPIMTFGLGCWVVPESSPLGGPQTSHSVTQEASRSVVCINQICRDSAMTKTQIKPFFISLFPSDRDPFRQLHSLMRLVRIVGISIVF
jgi:hypothetical protein